MATASKEYREAVEDLLEAWYEGRGTVGEAIDGLAELHRWEPVHDRRSMVAGPAGSGGYGDAIETLLTAWFSSYEEDVEPIGEAVDGLAKIHGGARESLTRYQILDNLGLLRGNEGEDI